MEGCLLGIPSIGYSLLDHSPGADFDPLTPFIKEITAKVLAEGLPEDLPERELPHPLHSERHQSCARGQRTVD